MRHKHLVQILVLFKVGWTAPAPCPHSNQSADNMPSKPIIIVLRKSCKELLWPNFHGWHEQNSIPQFYDPHDPNYGGPGAHYWSIVWVIQGLVIGRVFAETLVNRPVSGKWVHWHCSLHRAPVLVVDFLSCACFPPSNNLDSFKRIPSIPLSLIWKWY